MIEFYPDSSFSNETPYPPPLALRLVSTKSHNKFNKDIICIISSIIIIIIFNEKLDSIIMVITHTMPCRLLVFVKQQGT
jgi:hypothetical protein